MIDGNQREDRQYFVAVVHHRAALRARRRQLAAGYHGRFARRGSIWNTPAVDPDLGLLYFATGNCRPDYDSSTRAGDNLFCASITAIELKTGKYVWHFQEVHRDIWDYDAASPVVLFDTTMNGQPRKAIAEAGRTGWVYILDRTNGKPLIGIAEKPVQREPRQKTAKTQPILVGDPTVPRCAEPLPGFDRVGCLFQPFRDTTMFVQPSGIGGTNWCPCRTARHRFALRRRNGSNPRLRPLRVRLEEWHALCRGHPGGADRVTDERHVHGDQFHHQQDRLAAEIAVSDGRQWRRDGHCRGPAVARLTRRQLHCAGRENRGGVVPVPDWILG